MPFTLISRMQDEGGLYFTVIFLLVAICKRLWLGEESFYHSESVIIFVISNQSINKKNTTFVFLY